MTSSCCGVSALSRLAVGPHGSTITRLDFIDFMPKVVKTLSDAGTKAIRGTLDHIDTDVGEGLLHVQFRTRFFLTSVHMGVLLPLLGFTNSSGNIWFLDNSLPYSKIIVGPASSPEDVYDNCVPTDFMVMGQKGADPVMIDVGWVGSTYASQANGTFFVSQISPLMSEGTVYPWGSGVNTSNVFSINGTTYFPPQVRLAVNYHTLTEFNNSVTATNNCPTDHDITVGSSVLYSTCDATTGLFTSPVAGVVTGGPLVLSFSTTILSGNSTSFTIANAKAIARPTRLVKNDFQRLPLMYRGYSQVQSGVEVPALQVTNVIHTS